ncbi:MAG: MBL fold metallo-hydrolase [Bacteroidetes bacterium]|nr:MBL fold metallo-hydrolase [Bacteroidota bacterium]
MTIQFLGAARTVTGSKHLITTADGKKILLDCGFFQGKGSETDGMNREFNFNPSEIDYLILSHAHIDHSGNIPNLVKQGFKGPIVCTTATQDLCKIMLTDSAHIQENDVKYVNKRRIKRGEEPFKPIYKVTDVEKCLPLFFGIDYNKMYTVYDGLTVSFTDSGHILGSGAVNLELTENGVKKRICFTGDIGRYNGSILKDPQPFPQAEYIIAESTYGDRLHTDTAYSEQQLFDVIYNTCITKKGKVIIPAFSLGRTQELVFALDQMEKKKMLPRINVYVDSPLSVNATNIMRDHPECFNADILEYMKTDPNPFGFNNLIYVQDVEDSKRLNELKEPCIIISASGMADAGRIKHHIANNVSNPKNTILMVGYAEPHSLGGKLRAGNKVVKIFGEEHEVKAEVIIIDSYSAHGDYNEMIQYLGCQDKKQIKKLFLVHGEYEVQLNYKEKLIEAGFKHISIPEQNDIVEIN